MEIKRVIARMVFFIPEIILKILPITGAFSKESYKANI